MIGAATFWQMIGQKQSQFVLRTRIIVGPNHAKVLRSNDES